MILDVIAATVGGDSLPTSKTGLFSKAAGAAALASAKGKKTLVIEALEFCGLPLNKLNDGSRGSQDVLSRFNVELGQRVSSGIGGATLLVKNKALLSMIKGGKGGLVSDLGTVKGSVVVVAPASSADWKSLKLAASEDPKRTIVLINPTRNTMPLDGSMDAFEYCYYLRRLTYGLLSVSGCGRDCKSWEGYRQARPTLADNYGQSPTGPPIVQVSGDLQERAGYMSMGKK